VGCAYLSSVKHKSLYITPTLTYIFNYNSDPQRPQKQKMPEIFELERPVYNGEDADTEVLQLSGNEYIEVESTPGYKALSRETARLEATFLYHGQWCW